MQFSYARYLLSKRTVDDRALNQHVVSSVRRRLAAAGDARHRVLELGAGLGTMVCRAVEWNLLRNADYTLLDIEASSLDEAMQVLSGWAKDRGMRVEATGDRQLEIQGDGISLTVRGLLADLEEYLSAPADEPPFDVLIANAFLDLVDLETVIPRLWSRLHERGTFWLTINFDGETIFLPEHPLDADVMRLYHRSMDDRTRNGKRAGDSKSGRHLYEHLVRANAVVEAAGASDWMVHPTAGEYVHDEAYFMHHILETVWAELKTHPELDAAAFEAWTNMRRRQIENGELVLVVHQLDYAGAVARR